MQRSKTVENILLLTFRELTYLIVKADRMSQVNLESRKTVEN